MLNIRAENPEVADRVRFWPNGFSPEASWVCKDHQACFWPMLPNRSESDVNQIWHIYWEQANFFLCIVFVPRGAELINRILVRQVEKQKEEEKDILMNIKQKMNALKERQAALRKDFKEPTEHFQGNLRCRLF